jgi:hypothetical protein
MAEPLGAHTAVATRLWQAPLRAAPRSWAQSRRIGHAGPRPERSAMMAAIASGSERTSRVSTSASRSSTDRCTPPGASSSTADRKPHYTLNRNSTTSPSAIT